MVRLGRFFLTFVFAFLFSAAASAQTLVRAATVENFPGFSVDDGKLSAVDPYSRIIADLEQELHIRFVWSAKPTLRLLTMVQDNVFDLCYPMGFTPERDITLRHSESVISSRDIFVYRKRPADTSASSLTVGCKTGSPQESWLRSRGYRVIAIGNYEQLAELLVASRVDMIDLPETIYENIIDKPDAAAAFLSETAAIHEVGFYYSPNFTLADALDRAIIKFRDTWQSK